MKFIRIRVHTQMVPFIEDRLVMFASVSDKIVIIVMIYDRNVI